jgi:hypothetical protein
VNPVRSGRKQRQQCPTCVAVNLATSDYTGKSPSAALRFDLRRCGVWENTPHFSGLARLASGAFCGVIKQKIMILLVVSLSFEIEAV